MLGGKELHGQGSSQGELRWGKGVGEQDVAKEERTRAGGNQFSGQVRVGRRVPKNERASGEGVGG